MNHALNFIKAYLDKKCPQGQSRVIVAEDKKSLIVSILKADGSGTQEERAYFFGEGDNLITAFCNSLLTDAGYDLFVLENNLEEFKATEGEAYIVEGN